MSSLMNPNIRVRFVRRLLARLLNTYPISAALLRTRADSSGLTRLASLPARTRDTVDFEMPRLSAISFMVTMMSLLMYDVGQDSS